MFKCMNNSVSASPVTHMCKGWEFSSCRVCLGIYDTAHLAHSYLTIKLYQASMQPAAFISERWSYCPSGRMEASALDLLLLYSRALSPCGPHQELLCTICPKCKKQFSWYVSRCRGEYIQTRMISNHSHKNTRFEMHCLQWTVDLVNTASRTMITGELLNRTQWTLSYY